MFARAFFLGRRLFGTALGHIVGENSRNLEKKFFSKKIHRGYEKTVFCDFFYTERSSNFQRLER